MLAEGITIGTGIVVSVVTALVGGIGVLFKLVMSSHAKEVAQLESVKKSYEEIASEAIKSAKETADFYRQKYEGKAPIILAAPVISESHSPSTRIQRETAAVATLRATLAKIKLDMGQEPRREPEHKKE